jgi:hypothetical protein
LNQRGCARASRAAAAKAGPAERHPGVLWKSQRVDMRVVEDVPELIYCLAISPRLFGNHALDLPQRKREKCFAAAVPRRSYRLGTGAVSHSFPYETRIHGLSWHERDQQPLANQRARTVAHTPEKARPLASKLKRIYAPRIISDHIMVQEDFERLHKFLLETEGLSEVSDDIRELVEDEWPELVHKLPPKVPTRR